MNVCCISNYKTWFSALFFKAIISVSHFCVDFQTGQNKLIHTQLQTEQHFGKYMHKLNCQIIIITNVCYSLIWCWWINPYPWNKIFITHFVALLYLMHVIYAFVQQKLWHHALRTKAKYKVRKHVNNETIGLISSF